MHVQSGELVDVGKSRRHWSIFGRDSGGISVSDYNLKKKVFVGFLIVGFGTVFCLSSFVLVSGIGFRYVEPIEFRRFDGEKLLRAGCVKLQQSIELHPAIARDNIDIISYW